MTAMRHFPLKALRAFEAAGRHNSFTKAADELCVSIAAISQQVRLLEDIVGSPLFERTSKGLLLTDSGRTFFPLIKEGFSSIRQATEAVANLKPSNEVRVSMLPSVASQWLGRYVLDWSDSHPQARLSLTATHAEPDMKLAEIDFRICYGKPYQKDVEFEPLFTDFVTPVCAPSFLERHGDINTPEELLNAPLLEINWGSQHTGMPSWSDWFEACDLEPPMEASGPEFNLSSMAIQSALDGRGVVLGQEAMVRSAIAEGRLVKLFDTTLDLPQAYYVSYPERSLKKPLALQFLESLREASAQ